MTDINDLIGKPFSEDGYGPDSFSCYGLAVEVFKRYGINIPKTNISVCACKATSEAEIKKHIGMYWDEVKEPLLECKAPLIILIKAHPGYAQHIGIYIGDNRMIHVSVRRNVCIDKMRDWNHKIKGYYKYVNNNN